MALYFTKNQLPQPGFKQGEKPRPVPADRAPKLIREADTSDGEPIPLTWWYNGGDKNHPVDALVVTRADFYPDSRKDLIQIVMDNQSGRDGVNFNSGEKDSSWIDNGRQGGVVDYISKYVARHNTIAVWFHDKLPSGWQYPGHIVFAFPGEHGFVDLAFTMTNWGA